MVPVARMPGSLLVSVTVRLSWAPVCSEAGICQVGFCRAAFYLSRTAKECMSSLYRLH